MTVYSSSVPVVYQAAILCAGLLLFAAFLARRKLVSGEGVIPDEGFSLRNIFEVLTEYLYDMAESIMGEHARTYFPICAAIFLSSAQSGFRMAGSCERRRRSTVGERPVSRLSVCARSWSMPICWRRVALRSLMCTGSRVML